eukprot:12430149-Ditylum_brightwellii.AAC.1
MPSAPSSEQNEQLEGSTSSIFFSIKRGKSQRKEARAWLTKELVGGNEKEIDKQLKDTGRMETPISQQAFLDAHISAGSLPHLSAPTYSTRPM